MSIREYFAGKEVLITGATGLVGKVLLEKILHDLPEIPRVYVLIRKKVSRAGKTDSPQERLHKEILASSAFDRLRQIHGDSFSSLVRDKVEAVPGDLAEEHLGMDDLTRLRLQERVRVIINCAAVVTFDAPIGAALNLNTLGPMRILEFARGCADPVVAHVSTCYVNGTREGVVSEDPLDPTQAMLQRGSGRNDPYDVDEEVEAISSLIRDVEDRSLTRWRRMAFAYGARRGKTRRGNSGEHDRSSAAETLRREWVDRRLIKEGMRWSRRRGWNDVYTFTKAMGEQMIMRHRGNVPTVIFRPSIIESAFESPMPGWLDGMRMIDPLIVAYGRGQLVDFPGNPDATLDLVPVDMVVNALLASVPGAPDNSRVAVYQLATGMNNHLTMREFCELVQDSFQRQALSGRGAPSEALPSITFPSAASFLRGLRYRQILPLRALEAAAWLGSLTSWGRRRRNIFRARRSGAERLAYWARLYSPYTGVLCRYQSEQMGKVLGALDDEERQKFNFDVAGIDWRHYVQDIHIPGVRQFLLGIKPKAGLSPEGVNTESQQDKGRPQTGPEAPEEKKGRPARTPSATGRRHPMITDLPEERELTIWVGSHRLRRPARAMTRWLLALAYRYYLGFEFEGVEHVPTSGPVIVVANHNSHLDTGALLVVLGNRIRDLHPVAAKDYWFRDRLWSWASRTFINAIPFDRHARLSEGLGLAVALLRQNHSLLYFPEGGRSVTGEMRPFKAGVGVLALESGASIVPTNITGSFEALAKGSWLPKRREIRVRFGTPIPVDQYFQPQGNGSTQELARRITDDAQKAVEALC